MNYQALILFIITAIISSVVTRYAITYIEEPFASLPGIPDILNHMHLDTANIVRDDSNSVKLKNKTAMVISGLNNGVKIKKMVGVESTPFNRNLVRITNGSDARNSPCWGYDFAVDSSLLYRHYPKGFHPTSVTSDADARKLYSYVNWFLRLYPRTNHRYDYYSIMFN